MCCLFHVDLSFPDESESENDDDITNVSTTTTQSFHSMAEIASCSYEARKVGICTNETMNEFLKNTAKLHLKAQLY